MNRTYVALLTGIFVRSVWAQGLVPDQFFLLEVEQRGALAETYAGITPADIACGVRFLDLFGGAIPIGYEAQIEKPFNSESPLKESFALSVRTSPERVMSAGVRLKADIAATGYHETDSVFIDAGEGMDPSWAYYRVVARDIELMHLRWNLSLNAVSYFQNTHLSFALDATVGQRFGYERTLTTSRNTVESDNWEYEPDAQSWAVSAGVAVSRQSRARLRSCRLVWSLLGHYGNDHIPLTAPSRAIDNPYGQHSYAHVWHGARVETVGAGFRFGIEPSHPYGFTRQDMLFRGRILHGVRFKQAALLMDIDRISRHDAVVTYSNYSDTGVVDLRTNDRRHYEYALSMVPEVFLRKWISVSVTAATRMRGSVKRDESTPQETESNSYEQTWAELSAALNGYVPIGASGLVSVSLVSGELVLPYSGFGDDSFGGPYNYYRAYDWGLRAAVLWGIPRNQ